MKSSRSEIIFVPLPHSSIILSSNGQEGNIQHLSDLTESKYRKVDGSLLPLGLGRNVECFGASV